MALAVDLARAFVESMSTSLKGYLTIFKTQREILFSHQDEDNSHQYNHSLKTVWQLSFDRIRTQYPLAAEILDACTFLQPEFIPVSLFKRQHSVLTLPSHFQSSLTSSEADKTILKAFQEAIAVLVKFSFVTRTLNEDINKAEDPASDILLIHRIVQKVIYDTMSEEQRIRLAWSLAKALKNEIKFSDSYSPLTRTTMNAYLLHIRHFAKMFDIGQKALMSEDLFNLMIWTINYLIDNGVYFGVEEIAQFTLSISECIHEPESDSMATSLDLLATLYSNQGYYAKADPLYERALVIREKALEPKHPSTAGSLNNLAVLYEYQGNHAKSESLHERALTIFEKVLGPEHPNAVAIRNHLATS